MTRRLTVDARGPTRTVALVRPAKRFHRNAIPIQLNLGESAGIEDSSSMKMEMESLNATSAKILRGNGKRAEQVGEDTGRNMAPLN